MIPAIPAIPSVASAVSTGAAQAAPAAGGSAAGVATQASSGTAPTSFADVLGNALDSLNATQQSATNLSLQAAAGNGNIADVTVATTEADLETQLVTAVRDKAVAAFNSVMDMQA